MLDPRLLRAFAAIVDAGSFTLAADRLNMTQSTISQQLARLEDAVGQVLIDRTARPIQATPPGERLLGYARRILALQQEAASALGDPAGTVSGELDTAIAKEPAAGPDHRASFPEPMAWFESADAPPAWPHPLPLVAFPPGGLYREAMFERVEQEQHRWYLAFTGNSLHNVLVAVEAGLGLSLLPVNAVAGYRVRRSAAFQGEPPIAVSIYAREGTGPLSELVDQMAAVLAARCGQPSS